jgi:choline dehydrogenase-like flavoprotein
MVFTASTYQNLIAQSSQAQEKLFNQYSGTDNVFDVIIIGSGIGGGILADDLIDGIKSSGKNARILVLEAGSYVHPTHVYNICRFPNADLARNYAVTTYRQKSTDEKAEFFIGEKPQLNFGGRSIFWSGLIPEIQQWEQEFFPPKLRLDLPQYLENARVRFNESKSMGSVARKIVELLRSSAPSQETGRALSDDFIIRETPRALHQPYLKDDGTPTGEFFVESTGVFNTAELLINQSGLANNQASGSLSILLNQYVLSISKENNGKYQIKTQNTLDNSERIFTGVFVILAAGSIESPKIVRRSTIYDSLPNPVKLLVGKGLTDHPTSDFIQANISHIGSQLIPRNSHAKIMCYSKGLSDGSSLRYPFNVEININHEYWHLRENDPTSPVVPVPFDNGSSKLEMKFSFGNLLDDQNLIELGNPTDYTPMVNFRNHRWTTYLQDRFEKLAGWKKDDKQIFATINQVARLILAQFTNNGQQVQPFSYLGENEKGFGYGTVHHAVGTLRMPFVSSWGASQFNTDSVVSEDLMLSGHPNLFVCDMSVMPYSSAANPALTLSALALRLSKHIQDKIT